MIPPTPGSTDHGRRRGPSGWSGPLAVIFLLLGGVFAFLLYRLGTWAKASAGSSAPVQVTMGDVLLLGGGSVACFVIAGVLLRWRRRN